MNKKKSLILLTVIIPVFAILAGLVTYFFVLRSDTPAPVSIDNVMQQQSKDITNNVATQGSVVSDDKKKSQDNRQSNSGNETKSISPQTKSGYCIVQHSTQEAHIFHRHRQRLQM